MRELEGSAGLINLSSRQSLLLERIGVVSELIVDATQDTTRDEARAVLVDTANSMAEAHAFLTGGRISESVRTIYFDAPQSLNDRCNEIAAHALNFAASPDSASNRENPHYRYIETAIRDDGLEEILATATLQRQIDAEGQLTRLRHAKALVLLGYCLATIASGVLVVRPLVRRVRTQFDTLEERIEARTIDLASRSAELEERVADLNEAQTALETAKDEAENANMAKTEFLSRMSHDLRTPLNSFLGFAQLLDMDPDLQEQHRTRVQRIVTGGQHLLDLINDVLDLARIEQGRIALSPESIAVKSLVRQAIDAVQPLATAASITVASDLVTCEASITADPTRVRQVLLISCPMR